MYVVIRIGGHHLGTSRRQVHEISLHVFPRPLNPVLLLLWETLYSVVSASRDDDERNIQYLPRPPYLAGALFRGERFASIRKRYRCPDLDSLGEPARLRAQTLATREADARQSRITNNRDELVQIHDELQQQRVGLCGCVGWHPSLEILMSRVNQYHPCDVGGVGAGIQPHVQASYRVCCQYVGNRHVGGLQQRVQLADDLRG